MKNIVSIFFVSLSAFFVSCNNQTASLSAGSANETEKRNLAADSTIIAAFQTGDVSKIDSAVAPDFVDHSERGDRSRDSLKVMAKMVHDSMPDSKMELIDHVAHGDYVYSWMRFTGNSRGQMGMPPGPYDFQMMQVAKFKDGKAVEHWSFADARDVGKMQQEMMNMMQQSGMKNMNKPDTMSKMKTK